MPALAQALLNTKSHSQRERAVHAMSLLRETAAPIASTLAAALRGSDLRIRRSAVRALGEIGVAAVVALPELLDTLVDEEVVDLRHFAARALCGIGSLASPTVPRLVQFLTDTRPDVRQYAAQVLGSTGRAAAPAAAQLTELALADESSAVRRQSLLALKEAAVGVPELAEALEEKTGLWESWGDVEDLEDLKARMDTTLG
eukprot:gnl/TRDRNA2_/TRDRNA2_45693_c0_seq1.p1 gnl/TRDRNA2_/TRDRNA2_45693_c0~~gnl/TRDRNA2_/TRDRNA2_45693_c0_seq1.p1  ORF type:complete len:223 (+),score=42.12 gnl/TRDRNA2_/TRDRNA2_45693_c0_seq1:69-671(+)